MLLLTSRSCSVEADTNHPLTDVLAREEPDQRLRRALEPLDDLLHHVELSLLDPRAKNVDRRSELTGMVRQEEPLDSQALSDHETWDAARRRRRLGCVVEGDRTAADDSPVELETPNGQVERVATHIVEVDVEPFGARFPEVGFE